MSLGEHRGLIIGSAFICAVVLPAAAWSQEVAAAQPAGALTDLSLEQLSDLQVTSVSRSAQSVGEAPAAIYVITSDDIVRAGLRSIPAALRLAPNLQVARLDSATYGITARGFNQSSGTANKLLVLMDGRVVYTPLYSGVFWDEQNALMEDLDRIEVVSGPGGTLWGSNAVNGVINIVSRDAHETTGLLASAGASETSQALGLRYGARIGDAGAFRVYGLGLRRAVDEPNEWRNIQGGFRADWGGTQDTLTLQGDMYGGESDRLAGQASDTSISGANLLGRWSRRFANDSDMQVQAYIDRTRRNISSGISADVDAAAIDAQYNTSPASAHDIVLGAGARVTRDTFTPGPGTAFLDPAKKTLYTYNAFAQDTMALTPTIFLIAGLKLEDNSYSGLEYLPSARVAWRADANVLVWAAISRAVRTPSRVDTELVNPGVLSGGPDFMSETLVAYELGYRAQPSARFWYSVSTYFNVYDDLRTVEATGPAVFPLAIRNGMHGDTYGLEAWGSYSLTDWWRLNAGVSLLHKDLKLDADSADITGVGFAGNDPKFQTTLRSLMDLGERTQLDLSMRYVDELPSPHVPSYVAVDARIGYRLTDQLELSVTGYNLDGKHVEFINPSLPARPSARSFFFSARWRS